MTRPTPGFSLVGTLAIMALLTLIALAMLSLSAVTLRTASADRYELEAKANARLALMVALGELQKHLGPDQRVSAPAAILDPNPGTRTGEGVAHPHWTAVWSSRLRNGAAVWVRGQPDGGLQDQRVSHGWEREREALTYLVSGNEGGRSQADQFRDALGGASRPADLVSLVREGALGSDATRLAEGKVEAPRVAVNGPDGRGHYAFWVGDLGTRANLATLNRRPDQERPLVSQQSSAPLVSSTEDAAGPAISDQEKGALARDRQLELLAASDPEWAKKHFHDVTVASMGVLSDVRQGGLKRDLSAYLHSDGTIPSRGSLAGLADSDRLVGPANEADAQAAGDRWGDNRHKETSPRFGLLRSWMNLGAAAGAGREFGAVAPKSEPQPVNVPLPRGANVNLNPATIAQFDTANLVPVLVEGSLQTNLSTHLLPVPGQTIFQSRLHLYPRVVLWNPYNVDLTLDRSMLMMQVNGRKEYHMTLRDLATGRQFQSQLVWLWAGRNSVVENPHDFWEHYENPYAGSRYYVLPSTTFGPGECLVFTCPEAREIDSSNLAAQELSCEVFPDPTLNFYSTNNNVNGGFPFKPVEYWEAPVNGLLFGRDQDFARNQADDYHMILKRLGDTSFVDHETFDRLPLISHVSCSLQYGAGKEPRVAWSSRNPVPIEFLDYNRPIVSLPPDVRTRDGFRMRWFREHVSNELGSGALQDNLSYFEEAFFGNWNPRAAYAARSPWANIGGDLPAAGFGGGPWFFGIYTRDLFDEEVGWQRQQPVWKDGRARGNPFGPPQDASTYRDRYILFEVPAAEDGIQSLAQFRHAKLSEFVWHPSMVVGQSLVDPRVGRESTHPDFGDSEARNLGGWDPDSIGWSGDSQRATGRGEWARFGRAFFQDYPDTEQLVYDLSFEVNHTLWDAFFVSSGSPLEMGRFLDDPLSNPLKSGRHVLAPATASAATVGRLRDFHQAAYHLMVDGMFNVNSTSLEAWKAMLGSTRIPHAGAGGATPFARFTEARAEWREGQADDDETWTGNRILTDEEIHRLAEAVVYQVKLRGPFLSLSDFVNRRLANDETGLMGPLQAAIEAAGLNAVFAEGATYGIDNDAELPDYDHPDHIEDSTRLDQTLKPDSKLWGTPAYLTQGDVLQVLGPALSARSDTFVIRAYGDAVDADGVVRGRAWCEAVVQRTPQPIDADETGLNSQRDDDENDFGRRFVIKSFRWLSPGEV